MHKRKRRVKNLTATGAPTARDDKVIDRERRNERILMLLVICTLVLGIVAMSAVYVWNMVPQDPVDVSETGLPQ